MSLTSQVTPFVITEPGIYELTHQEYHADPVPGGSLSSTGVRKLTPPDGSPARFLYDMGRVITKREYDFGQLAHNQVTGTGPAIEHIDADNYRTSKAQTDRDLAHLEGRIPVLPHEWDTVQDMMRALKNHAWAGALFEEGSGLFEPSFLYFDDGVWKRSRPDVLSHRRNPKTGQIIVGDYKTARSAERYSFTKSAYSAGYHQQGAWICDAVTATAPLIGLDLDGRAPQMLFIAQEKTPPYIVNVIECAPDALMWGSALNQEAVNLYKHCRKAGHWPGYSEDIEMMTPTPAYLTKAYEDFLHD